MQQDKDAYRDPVPSSATPLRVSPLGVALTSVPAILTLGCLWFSAQLLLHELSSSRFLPERIVGFGFGTLMVLAIGLVTVPRSVYYICAL